MITEFEVSNYKALRDVSVKLSAIHVLIGPNDAGKTSLLEAFASLSRSIDHPLSSAFTGRWVGRELVWNGDADALVTLRATLKDEVGFFEYALSCRFVQGNRNRDVSVVSELVRHNNNKVDLIAGPRPNSRIYSIGNGERVPVDLKETARRVSLALGGAHFYSWDPRMLALPVAQDSNRRFRMESSGFGLALCLDDILGFDRAQFTALEERFCGLFPQYRSIKLIGEPAFKAPVDNPEQIEQLARADGKGVYLEPVSGPLIPASQASAGTLLVLAYLAILYLPKPPPLILMEEPENGIHPSRLKEVVKILRILAGENQQSQVVLTTHSPYAVDLFEPAEVSLCTRRDDGSIHVTSLSDSSTVREQARIFTLGEIWTAEGDAALATPEDDRSVGEN